MNKLVVCIAAFAAPICTPVFAADMADKAPPPAPAPVFSWTGFYVGGNFGGGWAHSDYTTTLTGTVAGNPLPTTQNSGSANGSGIFGGGQIGFNYEFPANWVAGIEADIDAAHIAGSKSTCVSTTSGTVVGCGNRDSKIEDFGTVRGRLGYAFNNLLVYGTGGWAYGRSSSTQRVTCLGTGCPGTSILAQSSSATSSASANLSGWTAGGGVEWAFLPNWTLRVEYLHLQFNDIGESFNFAGTLPIIVNGNVIDLPVTRTGAVQANTGFDLIRVGVNYLFNWGGPPLARY